MTTNVTYITRHTITAIYAARDEAIRLGRTVSHPWFDDYRQMWTLTIIG